MSTKKDLQDLIALLLQELKMDKEFEIIVVITTKAKWKNLYNEIFMLSINLRNSGLILSYNCLILSKVTKKKSPAK